MKFLIATRDHIKITKERENNLFEITFKLFTKFIIDNKQLNELIQNNELQRDTQLKN